MKTILTFFICFIFDVNKLPIEVYKSNDNCKMLIRIDTATLKLDTVMLETNIKPCH